MGEYLANQILNQMYNHPAPLFKTGTMVRDIVDSSERWFRIVSLGTGRLHGLAVLTCVATLGAVLGVGAVADQLRFAGADPPQHEAIGNRVVLAEAG